MISIENRVGRLIENRFVTPLTEADLSAFEKERAAIMTRLGANRVVVLDLSKITVLPSEQADRLIHVFRSSRAGLVRNGILLPPEQAIIALQLSRILNSAQNSARRTFQSRDALVKWLSEVMTSEEKRRLEMFLDGR